MAFVKYGFRLLAAAFFSIVLAVQARADFQDIEIRILPESIVYGQRYTLGEIAELDGFDVETIQKLAKMKIGFSPAPGRSHVITERQIKTWLKRFTRKNKLELITPARAIVSRASIKISADQIEGILTEEIKQRHNQYSDIKIEIKTRLKDVFVPKGNVTYQIKTVGKPGRIGGDSTWILILELDKKETKRLLIRAKVTVFDEVVVAKTRIQKGKLVQKTDLTTIKKNISKERPGYKVRKDLVVGQQARRDILVNESVKSSLVESPMVMRKGAPVRLVYQTKNLRFSNVAIAMKSGRKGDVIPVRTMKSKKTIYAVIVDANNVEVLL